MRYLVQLVTMSEEGEVLSTADVAAFDKDIHHLEDVGLHLVEAKDILRQLQHSIIQDQAERYVESVRCCSDCGRRARSKDNRRLTLRTLFGEARTQHCCHQGQSRAPKVGRS